MADLNDDQSQTTNPEVDDQQKIQEGGDSKAANDLTQEETATPERKIYKLEELTEEKEYSDEEFEELQKLYEDTISDFVEGELVIGKILAINDKEVTVDIGFKSEGTVPLEEFTNPDELKVGDDVEVFLENIEDMDGQLILSRRKVDFIHNWERIVHSYESGEILQGRCTRRIKGGIVVDLGGVDAFLPGSQIDVKPIRDFDAFIGQTLDFKVVKVNQQRKNIVVSHRALVEEEMKGQREKILANLEKGQVLEGTVKNITDFGVFIDLGGVDGLLHINDLSWGRINHPSEIVSLDQTIKVKVLDFNDEKNRISLGLKQLQPHPWENVAEKYPVGSVVKGKVVNISDYGAFVELEKGVEGLIHISEMSWTQHIKHPSKVLTVGEIVETKILSIDPEEKKISLGLKQLEPDPWDSLEDKYPVGSRHQGIVRNLTNFGAFIELEEGIDGLIHISDLSWTKKIRHPGEVLKKGDTVEVVVLNVDRENRRISLGYKQTTENPWDELEEKYKAGTITKGKIVRLIEKGVIVELPDIVDGFVPLSHLAKPNLKKPSDGYKVDDELELCVLEFNKDAKKIVLSENIDYAQSLLRQKEGTAVPVPEAEEVKELFSDDKPKAAEEKPAEVAAEPEKTEAAPAEAEEKPATEEPAEEKPAKETKEVKKAVKKTAKKTKTKKEEPAAEEKAEDADADSAKAEEKKPAKKTTKKKTTSKKKTDDTPVEKEDEQADKSDAAEKEADAEKPE
ncbi:30S ribosomal protein S1 [candidate division KSB1 bacterium 4484_87]|nr:MAG: 30S ribosomal protein S1 [candidate division KSB1 bacterium 4484_87]